MRTSLAFRALITGFLSAGLLAGCHSYGVVKNEPTRDLIKENTYSLTSKDQGGRSSEVLFILSFSGGGTRAAAMAYGVMEELRDTQVEIGGKQRRLLDEVDYISSVSGGSFTSAYYGLYGERIFETFEDEFLRFDLQSKLVRSVINPFNWFGRKGRTEHSIGIYDKYLFHDATFADMMDPERPIIVINASDFSHGLRFSFVQEYFNFLCSDISTFPVSRAVAASSAVPVVFNPVVVENHAGCPRSDVLQRDFLLKQIADDPELKSLFDELNSYSDKENRKYIHFVDGGITDNMGLRAVSDLIQLSDGLKAYLERERIEIPRAIVLVSVNASTEPDLKMDATAKQPSLSASIGAQSNVQLHRYNTASLKLVKNQLEDWASSLSTPGRPVTPYLVEVTFENIEQPELNMFLNKIPTSFALEDEQVDDLIENARRLLREEPTFQELLADITKSQESSR